MCMITDYEEQTNKTHNMPNIFIAVDSSWSSWEQCRPKAGAETASPRVTPAAGWPDILELLVSNQLKNHTAPKMYSYILKTEDNSSHIAEKKEGLKSNQIFQFIAIIVEKSS